MCAAMLTCSCNKGDGVSIEEANAARRVMVLYSAGFNSLSAYLKSDITELKGGYVPAKGKGRDVLLVVTKPFKGSYSTKTSPLLIQLYKKSGKVVADTVKVYPEGQVLADAVTFRQVLSDIGTMYPAGGYGMIFSSHATGWMPEDYYTHPDRYDTSYDDDDDDDLLTFGLRPNTIGQEITDPGNLQGVQAEIDIEDLAAAFPFKLDYFALDACLGGCAEVAYALRNVTDVFIGSPAEIMGDGFVYSLLARRLLEEKSPLAVCTDYIHYYTDVYSGKKSATISLVNTSGLEALATLLQRLNSTYGGAVAALDKNQVQGFSGGTRQWFYDLEDIYLKAGISDEDKAALREALDGCIAYAGHTAQYYTATDRMMHDIDAFCGMTMFLPQSGGDYLRNYYKGLSWNIATGLIESWEAAL